MFQMALSWIFGKKKEEKPAAPSVEAVEVGSDEDYAIIQMRPGIYPQVPQPVHPYTPLPYPMLPQRQNQPAVGTNAPSSVTNQLEGIPFTIAPHLGQNSNKATLNQIENLRRAVFQIAADINDPAYQYDFKLESSILQEATAYCPDPDINFTDD